MSDEFAGRTAIVTGATRGIGYGIAHELLSRGANVVITARKPDELEAAVDSLGEVGQDRVAASRGPADDLEHQDATVDLAAETFGTVDILVNNAAVNPVFGPLVDVDLKGVRKIYEVNVLACLSWTQKVWHGAPGQQGMKDTGGGIVNIASIGGLRIGPALGAYNTSKAALIHLTKQLAQELSPKVRVNAIAPAVVKTDFARALWEPNEEGAAAAYPLKRLGTPDDTSKLVAFLLSDDSSWITGECVTIDGGASVMF